MTERSTSTSRGGKTLVGRGGKKGSRSGFDRWIALGKKRKNKQPGPGLLLDSGNGLGEERDSPASQKKTTIPGSGANPKTEKKKVLRFHENAD